MNWYLNQNYKWSINYDVTSFEGGAADGADRPDEKALFTRFALNSEPVTRITKCHEDPS